MTVLMEGDNISFCILGKFVKFSSPRVQINCSALLASLLFLILSMHVRKQTAAAYSHVLADSYVYNTVLTANRFFASCYTAFPWKTTAPIASPIPLKVILHGTIHNDKFWRNTAFQCWNNVVTIRNNVATMLQPCVVLKIAIANGLV